MTYKTLLFLLALAPISHGLEMISDEELMNFSGQNGVYLSGEMALNEFGGPLGQEDDPTVQTVWGSCVEKDAGDVSRCGARLSFKTNSTDGYLVLDDMRGKLSFEGLTLRARELKAGTDNAKFGNDVTEFLEGEDGRTVLEVGLPSRVKFENLNYSIATSSTARPTDSGFVQQDIFGVQLNGTIKMHGNMLIFPSGNE
jgi:hypothetical protein